jgi:hypothetical protein
MNDLGMVLLAGAARCLVLASLVLQQKEIIHFRILA